jgi:hypothetical protein
VSALCCAAPCYGVRVVRCALQRCDSRFAQVRNLHIRTHWGPSGATIGTIVMACVLVVGAVGGVVYQRRRARARAERVAYVSANTDEPTITTTATTVPVSGGGGGAAAAVDKLRADPDHSPAAPAGGAAAAAPVVGGAVGAFVDIYDDQHPTPQPTPVRLIPPVLPPPAVEAELAVVPAAAAAAEPRA